VSENAPVPLYEAGQSFQRAERAESEKEQRHYAYLTEKQTEQAIAEAKQKGDQQKIARLGRERQQVQLQAREQEAARAGERARMAEQRLQEAKSKVTVTMGDVMFKANEATLKPGALLGMDNVATMLQQHPNRQVTIEGHTDSTGSAAYNQQLSTARADAVRNALVERGVSPDRIVTRGLGESFPVASNETASGRQLNRRIDITVTG
jgi:outer membrane protein OmpA-like peptidoglycan-associated protein